MAQAKAIPDLKSIEETRKLLGGIGRSSFFRLVAAGELRPIKLGARSFFDAEEISDFIEIRRAERDAATARHAPSDD